VRLLGQRTGELHLALASHPEDPLFAPEPFTPFYQRSLYQSMRNLSQETFDRLRRHLPALAEDSRAEAEKVSALKAELLKRLRSILDRRIAAQRTRIHGNLHLGHVLWTGRDFVIIDFQGEPTLSLSSRRLKRTPLRDVARMIGSFHGAASRALSRHVERGGISSETSAALEPWAQYWALWVSSAFLRNYLRTIDQAPFVPAAREDLGGLLFACLVEQTLQQLSYEIGLKGGSVRLPLRRLARLVETER
jgi:maltose alpha-D-glucosyltransferase/alpha-amylase